MLLDASDWFLNEEIRLEDVSTLQRQELVEKLREQVAQSPYDSLLLVVHGFREAWAALGDRQQHGWTGSRRCFSPAGQGPFILGCAD
jgi:hypothetical protein